MKRTIFKSGNSTVIALPKEVIERLGVAVGDELEFEFNENERQIILLPAEPEMEANGVDETFARQVAEFIEEYRPALEALAKG